jgi:hypothetical protein
MQLFDTLGLTAIVRFPNREPVSNRQKYITFHGSLLGSEAGTKLVLASDTHARLGNVTGSQSGNTIKSNPQKLGYSHFKNLPLQGVSLGANFWLNEPPASKLPACQPNKGH